MLHQIASQIGQTEDDGGVLSAAVRDYLAAAGIGPDQYATVSSWSGALLAWGAIKSGLVPPINAMEPLRWLEWGGPLTAPLPGSVVILTGGAGRTTFQAGVCARVQARKVYVIGAFDRQVQTRAFPIEQVIGARRVPGTGPTVVTTGPLTIEHVADPAPTSAVAFPVAAAISAPEPAQAAAAAIHSAQVAPSDAVEKRHLEALLSIVRNEFKTVNERIDNVQKHAIGAVQISETLNP